MYRKLVISGLDTYVRTSALPIVGWLVHVLTISYKAIAELAAAAAILVLIHQ